MKTQRLFHAGSAALIATAAIMLTGCGVQSTTPSSSVNTGAAARIATTSGHLRNSQCQSIQATMPAGIYNKGKYHDETTGAVLLSLPSEITKKISQYDKSAFYAKYAVIAYRLNVSPPCPNGLMIPIEYNTKTVIVGYLNPGEVKISVVRDARAVNATTSIPGLGKYTFTKYVGNPVYYRILKIESNATYHLTIK